MNRLLLTLSALMFLAGPVDAHEDTKTCKGGSMVCEDLVSATITYKALGPLSLTRVCGVYAVACATLNITTKECTIYHRGGLRGLTASVDRHERNHCYGWTHTGDTHDDYASAWVVIHRSLEGSDEPSS